MSSSTAIAALAALLLAAGARAEEPKKDAPVDPKVEALIRQAVEKAKQELREEVRHELQTAQATAEFTGATAPGPKLQLLEVDGYFRVRGDLKDSYDLHRGADNAGGHCSPPGTGDHGNYIYPGPVMSASRPGVANPRSTMTGVNMRLRVLPTLNISERVRVRAEADLFDNYVLGSRPLDPSAAVNGAVLTDRPVINLKLAWGEVETPVGLLSFGRMPSVWGLGIVAPAQDGLDDDFGVIADRLQFATMPVSTVLGSLTFIPYLDFFANGPMQGDPRFSKSRSSASGPGQPTNLDSAGDGRVVGIKIVKLDTADELRRKLARGESSFNYGAFYEYTTLGYVFTSASDQFPLDSQRRRAHRDGRRHGPPRRVRPPGRSLAAVPDASPLRRARGDLPLRSRQQPDQRSRLRHGGHHPAAHGKEMPILLRQFGAVLRTSYQVSPNKVTLGLELAIASGDSRARLRQPALDGQHRPDQGALPRGLRGDAVQPDDRRPRHPQLPLQPGLPARPDLLARHHGAGDRRLVRQAEPPRRHRRRAGLGRRRPSSRSRSTSRPPRPPTRTPAPAAAPCSASRATPSSPSPATRASRPGARPASSSRSPPSTAPARPRGPGRSSSAWRRASRRRRRRRPW